MISTHDLKKIAEESQSNKGSRDNQLQINWASLQHTHMHASTITMSSQSCRVCVMYLTSSLLPLFQYVLALPSLLPSAISVIVFIVVYYNYLWFANSLQSELIQTLSQVSTKHSSKYPEEQLMVQIHIAKQLVLPWRGVICHTITALILSSNPLWYGDHACLTLQSYHSILPLSTMSFILKLTHNYGQITMNNW